MNNSLSTYFIDVIVPVAVSKKYCYRVPREFNDMVKAGQRVIVRFGKSKLYAAVIYKVHNEAPTRYVANYFESLLDEYPIVLDYQLKFWTWLEEYYLCNPGDVMVAALPAGFKLSSETRVVIRNEFNEQDGLNDKEYLIYEALQIQNVLDLTQISEILQIKIIYPYIKRLLEKGAILLEENVKKKYKPKIAKYLEIAQDYTEDEMREIFDSLEKRAPKQLKALMYFLKESQYFTSNRISIKKKDLVDNSGLSSTIFNALVNKEILTQFDKEVGRVSNSDNKHGKIKSLSEDQKEALTSIKESFKEKDVCLLHGVTSSGKTEIYVELIAEQIKLGKQTLYLVPEISLTTQLITRLKKYFGNQIGVYHSGYSQDERLEIWNDLLSGKFNNYKVIIGPRSALFLPFSDLNLIIIDEEHDSSYKQQNPAPRYNARDAALVLSKITSSKVLLGTATPSIESYWNAKNGNYGYVRLDKRYGNIQLPEILVADIKDEYKKRSMTSHFSSMLLEEMKATLDRKQQIILFQNRRGYNPLWQCEDCGHIPHCTQCDVSLTYHQFNKLLKCHYCGYSELAPKTCVACGSNKLKMMGFGTEKIEADLKELLPDIRVSRLDYDTTRKKNAYSKIIGEFESGAIDVLVGTQMVTKGLDFERVGLVGVLNADTMLNRSDFRAFERSFQMIIQVAGRAGRKRSNQRGRVIIQTYQPNHWIVQKVIQNDFEGMVKQELLERRNFKYPPFVRIIQLTLKHKKSELLDMGADHLVKMLKTRFGDRILGPEYPYVSRVRNVYQKQIILKIEREVSITKSKAILREHLNTFLFEKVYKSIRIVIDVDPQ